MHHTHDNKNEFQDPLAPGSLAGALRAWQALLSSDRHTTPQRITFTLLCPSESRARRVALSLRRRLDCPIATARSTEASYPGAWVVEGTTREGVQSLRSLEHLFTWLRRAAERHQVTLLEPVVQPVR